MQINSINTNINSPSFNGVVIHNGNNFIKAGLYKTYELTSSPVYSVFKKKDDYDLHLSANQEGCFLFKIQSVGRGFKGFYRNAVAPWLPLNMKNLNMENMEKYISKWHKKQ